MNELKEIREALKLGKEADLELCKENGWEPSTRFDDALAALSRLEAREAEAPKDAKGLVWLIRKTKIEGGYLYREANAAAEIERYVQARIAILETDRDGWKAEAARYEKLWCDACAERGRPESAPKTVPIEMLNEVFDAGESFRLIDSWEDDAKKIAARYGYTVTE